jgi:hypothetical protein
MQKWYLLRLCRESGDEGWKREVEGLNSSTIYLIHFKNSCKWQDVPPPRKTITTKKSKERKYDIYIQ